MVLGMVALISWLLLNGIAALDTVAAFPAKYTEVKDQYLSRYYHDTEWTGWWTTDTEGLVDSGDYKVSPTSSTISMEARHGLVHGEFSSRRVCEVQPLLGVLMYDGSLDRDAVHATAYQIIGGKRQNVLRFRVDRTKHGLAIIPVEDPLGLIDQQVDVIAAFSEPQREHRDGCDSERMAKIREIVGPDAGARAKASKRRVPVESLIRK